MAFATIQIQSVLYHNALSALYTTVENLANAISVTKKYENRSLKVTLHWGDASKTPLFQQQEIDELNKKYEGVLEFYYQFFNENTGTAKGHNKLAENCLSEYIMIMNPDVVVNPLIFQQLLAPFDDPTAHVGLTEARQTPIEHSKEYNSETGETSWASTACCLFPTSVYRQVGGFDAETFFMYCDDLDFSWMIRLQGYHIIYVPGAVVFHDKSVAVDGAWQPTNAERYYSAEAAILMAHKWSNFDRERQLLVDFKAAANAGDEISKRVIKNYELRVQEGRLPKPLDPNHKVAEFTTEGYGNYRFMMK